MTPEKRVEDNIKKALDELGAYFYKNFGGPHSNKGIPDIVGTYGLKNHPGKFFAIEVKRVTGGKPTPVQIKNLAKIARNGGIALISSDSDAATLIYQLVKGSKITVPLRRIRIRKGQPITVEKAHDIWNQRNEIKDCHNVLIEASKNADIG